MSKFFEVSIIPTCGSFEEYQCQPIGSEGWADRDDLIDEVRANEHQVFVLGEDEVPSGVEDIRGRIHNEPPCILAVLFQDGSVSYFGIVEVEDCR